MKIKVITFKSQIRADLFCACAAKSSRKNLGGHQVRVKLTKHIEKLINQYSEYINK